MGRGEISRRRLVSAFGSALAALTAGIGTASADPPERHIVGTSSRAATERAKGRARSVHRVLEFGGIGDAVVGTFPEEALRGLRRRPDVRYVEADGTMRAIGVDADDAEVPWGVDRVDAEKAHADGATGGSAHVSVVDTGIDSDHPDLEANLGAGRAFVSADGYAEPWDDDNGHGTHCAGIADAVDDGDGVVGVSTEATLHAVKVLDDAGSGSYSDVAAGIRWVADRGHDVCSMSLGGPESETLRDACRYASKRGVLLVAAAGNDGSDVEETAPATYETVMAVSATDSDDDFANFSNYGSDVELAAPGVDVYSTYAGGGYETLSGTSMACPHVAGAGGQLMARGLGRTDARQRLRDTAEDVGLSTDRQGAGLLDVEAAVSSSDAAPSVSWATPTDGDTVGGASVAVRVVAGDAEDAGGSLAVEYRVDDGSWRTTTYDSSSGYYEDSWEASAVADGEHTLTARATDSAGNTASSAITVTADTAESAPSVDSLALSEVETDDADAEFDATWEVSDADGDLSSARLALVEDSDGTTEEEVTVGLGGGSAGATTRLVAAGDDGSGGDYTVELTVSDGSDNAASATAGATEVEESNHAPTVESYSVAEAASPNPHVEITADWTVGDSDGDLETVALEVVDATGVVDSATDSVSGFEAAGSTGFKIKHARGETFDVRVTVTDGAGGSTTRIRTVTG